MKIAHAIVLLLAAGFLYGAENIRLSFAVGAHTVAALLLYDVLIAGRRRGE